MKRIGRCGETAASHRHQAGDQNNCKMSNLISRSELERIKASILPSVEDHSRIEKKKALKQKSDERLKNWPNTLEALRIKKESFLKDREAEDEARRQEVDREVRSLLKCYLHSGN